ncbi:MAG: hypothetical protein JO257_09605 [Deltaproteobacteria bacterium]|nr:hypothetical protein [Deltaproteobacteria bacterium]
MTQRWWLPALLLCGCSVSGSGARTGGPSDPRLATGPKQVMDIAIDATDVYWVAYRPETATSEVRRVPKAGGSSELVASVAGTVYQLALDDAYVYLPVYVQSAEGGPFLRVPKSGGALEVIDDHLRYLAFAAVANGVPYTAPLVDEPSIDYELWRYPGSPGAHEVVATHLDGPEAMAVNRGSIYVTTAGDSHLQTTPMSGGASVQPFSTLMALHVVSDGDLVYFMAGAIGDCTNAQIKAWRPGEATTLSLGYVGHCAADAAVSTRGVAVADDRAHSILQFPLDGSGPETLAHGSAPRVVAAEPDGSSIYWGDDDTGDINRIDQ